MTSKDSSSQTKWEAPQTGARISYVLFGIVILGAALRVGFLAWKGTLWLDEAMLAINLRENVGFLLRGNLHYDQRAPLGWLMLHKLLHEIFGPSALVLRATACLASIGGLVFLALTVRHALRPPAAIAVLGIAALSPSIVLYSAELKHYSFDFLAGAFFIWFVLAYHRQGAGQGAMGRPNLTFNLAAIATAMVSLPGVFCVAAAQMAIALSERDWPGRARRLLFLSAWVPFYAGSLLWFATRYPSETESRLHDYWGLGYMTNEASLRGLVSWPMDWMIGMQEIMLGSTVASFAAAGLLLCALLTWNSRLGWLTLCSAGVLFLAVAGSFLKLYPPVMRLGLFSLPAILVLTGIGIDWIASHPRRGSLLAHCIAALLSLSAIAFLASAIRHGDVPTRRLGVTPRIENVSVGVQALQGMGSEPILLIPSETIPALAFHHPDVMVSASQTWFERMTPLDPTIDLHENATFSDFPLPMTFVNAFVGPIGDDYRRDRYVATPELRDFLESTWRNGESVALLVTTGFLLYERVFLETETPYPPPEVMRFPGGTLIIFKVQENGIQ